jgi:hypothetical protein
MLTFLTLSAVAAAPSFQVADDAFLLNGSPIAIRSGSIHYHRTHPSTWADRLRRLHAMGLNAVQTYVPWNFHSQARGVYDFSGPRDLIAFVEAVQAEGLLLNLRAGPYIVRLQAAPSRSRPRANERDELPLARTGAYLFFARNFLTPATPSTPPRSAASTTLAACPRTCSTRPAFHPRATCAPTTPRTSPPCPSGGARCCRAWRRT